MKLYHRLYLICLFTIGISLSACKKQIAVDPPITKLVTANVFNDNGTATAAMLSIYSQLPEIPYNLHYCTALSSDELFSYNSAKNYVDMYTNSLIAPDAANNDGLVKLWGHTYNYIYQANAVLEGLNQSTKLNPKVKQQLTGEADFIRAYFYFNLVNLYGDVPLALTTDFNVNAALSRSPKAQVYQQIVKDLVAAQVNLSQRYVGVTDTTSTNDRIRPTAWAADALLARVYLYMGAGYFDKAEAEATKVITNASLFSLPSDLNAVFKENSSEAIWQIAEYQSTTAPYFTSDGQYFVLTTPPTNGTFRSSTISNQLMSAFEIGDQRKIKWIGTYTQGTNSWKYPAKYKDNFNTAASTSEYTMMLRLGEQYLIRAEARAQQGNTTDAMADLNVIRNRAGLANYVGAADQASLITAISHERQVELFVEGDRWINLKRTGTVDAVMSLVTPQKGNNTWHPYQQLYPLVPLDLQKSNKLVQNTGY